MLQLVGWHLHRSGRGSFSGRRLRKRSRHGGMEGNLPFDLLHDLMNMSVQHRDGTETLDVRQSLFAVVSSPSPLGIDSPQRNVRKEHNRSAGRAAFEIVLKPFQLFVTE